MHVRRFATTIEILTPAKLNLFLEVLAKRSDGYHEIETLISAIGVYDSLIFTPKLAGEIELHCRWGIGLSELRLSAFKPTELPREPIYGEIPTGPQNLVWKAVELIRNAAKIERGAEIQLIKRVPAAAGLGGGSSD